MEFMLVPEVVVVVEGMVVVEVIVVDEGMVPVEVIVVDEGMVPVEVIVVVEGMVVVEDILLPEVIVVVEVILVPEVRDAACAAAASERMRSAVSAIFRFICFLLGMNFRKGYSMKRARIVFPSLEAGVAVNHDNQAIKFFPWKPCRFLHCPCSVLHPILHFPGCLSRCVNYRIDYP